MDACGIRPVHRQSSATRQTTGVRDPRDPYSHAGLPPMRSTPRPQRLSPPSQAETRRYRIAGRISLPDRRPGRSVRHLFVRERGLPGGDCPAVRPRLGRTLLEIRGLPRWTNWETGRCSGKRPSNQSAQRIPANGEGRRDNGGEDRPMEAINVAQEPEGQHDRPVRRGCTATGCTCKDLRIVSQRRAKFYAYQADGRGQTAQRVLAADPNWRLPLSI